MVGAAPLLLGGALAGAVLDGVPLPLRPPLPVGGARVGDASGVVDPLVPPLREAQAEAMRLALSIPEAEGEGVAEVEVELELEGRALPVAMLTVARAEMLPLPEAPVLVVGVTEDVPTPARVAVAGAAVGVATAALAVAFLDALDAPLPLAAPLPLGTTEDVGLMLFDAQRVPPPPHPLELGVALIAPVADVEGVLQGEDVANCEALLLAVLLPLREGVAQAEPRSAVPLGGVEALGINTVGEGVRCALPEVLRLTLPPPLRVAPPPADALPQTEPLDDTVAAASVALCEGAALALLQETEAFAERVPTRLPLAVGVTV